MKVAYIRVSKHIQNDDLQRDAMEKEQCERTFIDHMSGTRFDRPEFLHMLDIVRPGDIVVVWRLDRLGRSLKELIETLLLLNEKGVELRSLKENIDTTTSTGKLMFHIIGAMAEFEHDVIVERTRAGLDAARARGRKGGRRYVLTGKKLQRAQERYERGDQPKEIMEDLGIKKTTFYRYVKTERQQQQSVGSPVPGEEKEG